MDLTPTITPRSDQLNADDLVASPITARITAVSVGTSEQPVNIHLEGYDGRPYKPSKSMRRVLVAAWGKDSDAYIGRALTLYRDPGVKYAGQAVGGIRISHMSNIDKPIIVPLTITRGKRESYKVQPLQTAPQATVNAPHSEENVTLEQKITTETSLDALRIMWSTTNDPELREAIQNRVTLLQQNGDHDDHQ